LRIVDIADPYNLHEVAFYDLNDSASCRSFGSNWGVYPFSKLIYASDMQEGLYVFEFDDHVPANLTGQVVDAGTNLPVGGAMVYFRDEYPTTRANAVGQFEIPWFKRNTVTLVTEATGYVSDTTSVATDPEFPTFVSIRLNPLKSAVAESGNEPAKEFALLPAYPNPFSATSSTLGEPGTTQITFRLPRPTHARLEVYNVFGQRVRILVQAPRSAGEHRVPWNGRDETGQLAATGVYLLQLRAGEFVATRRITVIR
jgi:hypothetical protein